MSRKIRIRCQNAGVALEQRREFRRSLRLQQRQTVFQQAPFEAREERGRDDQRDTEINRAIGEQRGDHLMRLHAAAERKHHGRFEYADAARRMADHAEQHGRGIDRDEGDEAHVRVRQERPQRETRGDHVENRESHLREQIAARRNIE
jgi:hypothetical protein